MKTLGYIEEIKKKFSVTEGKPVSDYRVAQLLKTSKQAVSRYVNHDSTFDDGTATKVGELLNIPAYVVIIDMHYERAKKKNNVQVVQAWRDISKKITSTAAAVLIATSVTSSPIQQHQSEVFKYPDNNNYRNIAINLFLFVFGKYIKPFMRPVNITA